jgi:hypothetical protein
MEAIELFNHPRPRRQARGKVKRNYQRQKNWLGAKSVAAVLVRMRARPNAFRS